MAAWDAAQAQVATQYDPQQAAIQRAIDQARSNTIAGEQSLQGYGQQGRDIIGQNYGTLYGLLGQNRAQQATDLGNQANLTEQGYDQAQNVINQGQQGSRDFISQMAQQMGQQGAGLKSATDLEQLVGQQTGRNSTARATFGGNLRDWGSRMDSISGQGIDSAHQAEALRKSEFESQLLELLGANKLQGTQQENDMTGQLSDVLGQRQSSLIAAYNQLAQQEWENSFKQAQLDSQNAQSSAELSLRAQGMAADNAYRNKADDPTQDILKWLSGNKQQGFENDLATKNYMLDKQKTDASLQGDAMDPLSLISFASENGFVDKNGKLDLAGAMGAINQASGYLGGGGGPGGSGMQALNANSTPAGKAAPNPNTGWQYSPFRGYKETKIGAGGMKLYR